MYDSLIIGNDLSSVIAALAANRAGLKTALITENDLNELEKRQEGYIFSSHSLPLVCAFGLLSGWIRDLLCLEEELSLVPCMQVITEGHRVNIFPNHEDTFQEMVREFQGEEKGIDALYKRQRKIEQYLRDGLFDMAGGISPMCWTRRRSNLLYLLPMLLINKIRLSIEKKGISPEVNEIQEMLMGVFSSIDTTSSPSPLSAFYLMNFLGGGIYYPKGGRDRWMNNLYRKYESEGGTLYWKTNVLRLDLKPALTVDLYHESIPQCIRAQTLIVSAQWEKLDSLVLDKQELHATKRKIRSLIPSGYPFSLHFGVKNSGLPEQLAPYTVFSGNRRASPRRFNYIFLETSLNGEPGRAPSGNRAVTATVYLPTSPLALGNDELNDVYNRMFTLLGEYLPFLCDNVDYIRVEDSIDVSRRIQDVASLKYVQRKGSMLGMDHLSIRTSLPHVFLIGSMLIPGMGIDGEIIASLEAINEVKKVTR